MMWIIYALAVIGAGVVGWLAYAIWHWLFREVW